jgi:uncharacterized repeat protein (TIGR01451 family)
MTPFNQSKEILMKNITRFMQKISKRTYAVAAVALATVVIPASLLAWGPSTRVTFTLAKPADYVTFNSITDNKQYGDERDFVQVRSVTDNTQFGENTTLTPGKEYEVFAYYHNNASTSLNDAAHNYAGIATGAYMRTQMPSTVAAGGEARITSFVGATNAKHLDANGTNLGNQVWDDAFGKNSTNSAIALSYVSGSAKITSNGAVNGKTLSDSLFSTGTPLGYNALDGKLPGCLQYSGYVTYRFKVDQPNFTVAKTVSAHEANSYVENLSTTAGSTVDFKVKYLNTGSTTQHVTVRDTLPAGLEYVAGSTYYSSSATSNQWKASSYDTVTKQGLGIGAFAPGAAGYVKFSAKVVAADKLACGVNTLTNTAAADTENGSKSDTASVSVTKVCTQPKDVKVCRLSDKKIVTISETEYNANKSKYSTNLNDCKTVVTPNKIQVCRLSDKQIVTIDEKNFDSSVYSKDFNDFKTPDTPTTPTTPTTPAELPHTGIADGVMSALGLSSLVAATSYYRASRKSLQN